MRRAIVWGTVCVLGAAVGTASAAKYVITDDEASEIVGEVQKPDVTVVISRENLNKAYELDLEESFIDKVIESVEHDPF
jgi:arginine repressor